MRLVCVPMKLWRNGLAWDDPARHTANPTNSGPRFVLLLARRGLAYGLSNRQASHPYYRPHTHTTEPVNTFRIRKLAIALLALPASMACSQAKEAQKPAESHQHSMAGMDTPITIPK